MLIFDKVPKNPGTSDIRDNLNMMRSDHKTNTFARDLGLNADIQARLKDSVFCKKSSALGQQETPEETADRERQEALGKQAKKEAALAAKKKKVFNFMDSNYYFEPEVTEMCKALVKRSHEVIDKAAPVIGEVNANTSGLKDSFQSPVQTLSFRRDALNVCVVPEVVLT